MCAYIKLLSSFVDLPKRILWGLIDISSNASHDSQYDFLSYVLSHFQAYFAFAFRPICAQALVRDFSYKKAGS